MVAFLYFNFLFLILFFPFSFILFFFNQTISSFLFIFLFLFHLFFSPPHMYPHSPPLLVFIFLPLLPRTSTVHTICPLCFYFFLPSSLSLSLSLSLLTTHITLSDSHTHKWPAENKARDWRSLFFFSCFDLISFILHEKLVLSLCFVVLERERSGLICSRWYITWIF